MPWSVESVEQRRRAFVYLLESGAFTMTALCRQFGISRPTGYALWHLYQSEGIEGLSDNHRQRRRHPLQTSVEIEREIVDLRQQHPTWGARKLRVLLLRSYQPALVPSETTVNHIMKMHGLTVARKSGRRHVANAYPIFDPDACNQIWSADFKGKFRLGNLQYCNPLTIADSFSRYVFSVKALERADAESCKPEFERVFREFGLPDQLHTDNGPPFGNAQALRRMTRLAVWLMELGITPVYSDPGKPQQNGRHERMHRDLKAEATRPAEPSFARQQRRFDAFRNEYNEVRPHEAIGLQTPDAVHQRSRRGWPGIIRDWDYPAHMRTKMISINGTFRSGSAGFVMVSSALSSKYIGLEEVETGLWSVYYRHVPLGYFSERTMRVEELPAAGL